MTDLQTWTPAEIDTALAEIWERYYEAARKIQTTLSDVRRFEQAEARHGEGRYADTLAHLDEALQKYRAEAKAIATETVPFDREFDRRGGWTRAWKVTNNGGHVHSSRACSTCYATTEFGWLPEISGLDESEIVDLAGEAACSICYPTAPVAPKPCRLFTKAEKVTQAERDAKAAAKAEREAKRIAKALSADGSPVFLRLGGWREEIKTITTARQRMTDAIEWGWVIDGDVLTLAQMIAAKEEKTVETVLAEARKRAEKRSRA